MKTAYFDCFSGISGDMCLGALVDAGVDPGHLSEALKKLKLKNYTITSDRVYRNGISASKVSVNLTEKHAKPKRWIDIQKTINASGLSEGIKLKGTEVFKILFEAEARVHGELFSEVHLHELGGVDCLIDIFGTLIGLEMLGVGACYCSAVNLGSGVVRTAHGVLPVPAPATAELLRGFPVYMSDTPFELTTPTGAALLKGLGAKFLNMPEISLESIGYGAGDREFSDRPNVLRLLLGSSEHAFCEDRIAVIETNIDDMNPQFYEDVMESLLSRGALDVFLEQIVMKKSRPAVKLTVIAYKKDVEALSELIFRATTTLGVRIHAAERRVLDRKVFKIATKHGEVKAKASMLNGEILNITPEYDDLRAIAKKTGLPVRQIAGEVTSSFKSVGKKINPKSAVVR